MQYIVCTRCRCRKCVRVDFLHVNTERNVVGEVTVMYNSKSAKYYILLHLIAMMVLKCHYEYAVIIQQIWRTGMEQIASISMPL